LTSNPTDFGEKIKQYRIQKGLSLINLAKELGIDPGTLARWERGIANPNAQVNIRLREFIDLSSLREA
jgi:transcriptional regulator with XRE-family HTH domain